MLILFWCLVFLIGHHLMIERWSQAISADLVCKKKNCCQPQCPNFTMQSIYKSKRYWFQSTKTFWSSTFDSLTVEQFRWVSITKMSLTCSCSCCRYWPAQRVQVTACSKCRRLWKAKPVQECCQGLPWLHQEHYYWFRNSRLKKLLTTFWKSLQKWQPDDRQGFQLGLKLD